MSFALLILLNFFLGGLIYLALNLKLARMTEEGISRKLRKDFTTIVDEFNQTADANISLLENRIGSLKTLLSTLDQKVQREWRENDSFQIQAPKVNSQEKAFPFTEEKKFNAQAFVSSKPEPTMISSENMKPGDFSNKKVRLNVTGNTFSKLKKIFLAISGSWKNAFQTLEPSIKKNGENSNPNLARMAEDPQIQTKTLKEKNPGIIIQKKAHHLTESLMKSNLQKKEPMVEPIDSVGPTSEEFMKKNNPFSQYERFDIVSDDNEDGQMGNHWAHPDEEDVIFEQKIPFSAFAKKNYRQRGEEIRKAEQRIDYESVDILNDRTATLPSDFWKMNKEQRFQYIAGLVRQGFPIRDLSALTHMSLGEIELIASLNRD